MNWKIRKNGKAYVQPYMQAYVRYILPDSIPRGMRGRILRVESEDDTSIYLCGFERAARSRRDETN